MRESRDEAEDSKTFLQMAKAKCTASIPGIDEKHGPDRVVDGLDATYYKSREKAKKGDWVEIVFDAPVKGRFKIYTGERNSSGPFARAIVEASAEGKRWERVGGVSVKDGVANVVLRSPIKRIRIVYTGSMQMPLVLRKIVKEM